MATDFERLEEFKTELHRTAVLYREGIDSGDLYHAIINFAAEAALPTPGWASELKPDQHGGAERLMAMMEERKAAFEREYQRLRKMKQREEDDGPIDDPQERTKRVHARLEKDRERETKLARHNAEAAERRQEEARKRQEEQRQQRRERVQQATERNERGLLNQPRPTQLPAE